MIKSIFQLNKKILFSAATFLTISVAVIIMSIISILNKPGSLDIGKPISYIDEITGERVDTTSGVSNGAYMNGEKIPIMGSKQLLDKGIPSSALKDLGDAIISYTDKSGIKNNKISYYKESYKKISRNPNTYALKIAINNAEKNLYSKIVYKGIDNYDILLYDDEKMNNEVHKFSYCSLISCPQDVDTTRINHN